MQTFTKIALNLLKIHLALVDVDLAVPSGETKDAVAGVIVDAVNAGGSIQARVCLALVNVHLTVHHTET